MFIRFRKLPCGGFQPRAAAEPYIACRSPWNGIPCRGHCREKPRCRWRIGREEELAPYRLKVILVENKRVNGKVKQETIAVLGSIEATLLPEFWEEISPERAGELKAEDWELRSLQRRTAFWEGANRRLKKLANRLGPDLKRIRIAAHSRVPYPMEAGKKRLEILEVKEDLDFFKGHIEYLERRIAGHEKIKKKAEQEIAEDKKGVLRYTLVATDTDAKLVKLSNRRL